MAEKTASDIMHETSSNIIGLALIYIEHERQMCNYMHNKNNVEVARKEGILEAILMTAKLLGVDDLYSKTITNLRFAIQTEEKERL